MAGRRRHVRGLAILVCFLVIPGACNQSPTATTTPTSSSVTSAESPATTAPNREGPQVPPIDTCSMFDLDQVDEALGLLEIPLEERGIFTFSGGEACAWVFEGAGPIPERRLDIAPGAPADFEPGGEIEGRTGMAIADLADAAVWFGGDGEGVLSVAQETGLGYLLFRIGLNREDLDDRARLEVVRGLVASALPQFPGMAPEELAPVETRVEPEPPDLSASDYVENLLAKEAAGEWDRGEGLVATLGLLAGEVDVDEVLRNPSLGNQEGTGLIKMAHSFLQTEPASESAPEIVRLLESMLFSGEQLESMAGISPTALRPGLLATGTVQGTPLDCAKMFPGEPGVGICLEYRSSPFLESLYPGAYRVFVPAPGMPFTPWVDDDFDLAIEALEDGVPIYKELGLLPAVDLVFSAVTNPGTLAWANSAYGQRCQVTLFANMQKLPAGRFKQTIAHELAHCFQDETFVEQNQVPYEIVKWREEGFAEYLSAVVYPAVSCGANRCDDEWTLVQGLPPIESATMVTDGRSYDNSVFFQHLHWSLGTEGLIRLVAGLPDSGGWLEQTTALGNNSDIALRLHEFVEGLTDASIRDSGGGLVPYSPEADVVAVAGPEMILTYPLPFGTTRLHFFVGQGTFACLDYHQTQRVLSSWRPGAPAPEGSGTWNRNLPDVLDRDAVFVATTTSPVGGEFSVVIEKVVGDRDECEEAEESSESCLELLCGPSGYYWLFEQLPDWLQSP